MYGLFIDDIDIPHRKLPVNAFIMEVEKDAERRSGKDTFRLRYIRDIFKIGTDNQWRENHSVNFRDA
jgi:hypothetical protein